LNSISSTLHYFAPVWSRLPSQNGEQTTRKEGLFVWLTLSPQHPETHPLSIPFVADSMADWDDDTAVESGQTFTTIVKGHAAQLRICPHTGAKQSEKDI